MGLFSTTRSDAATKIQARQRGKSTRRRLVAEALEPLRAKAKAEAEKKEEEAANKVVEKLEKAYVRQVTDDPTAKFEEKGQVTEQMVEKAARGFGARFLLTLEVLASFAQNLVILFSLRLPWPEELVRWFSNLFGFLFFVPDLLGWMFDLIFLVAELLGALLDQLAVYYRQLHQPCICPRTASQSPCVCGRGLGPTAARGAAASPWMATQPSCSIRRMAVAARSSALITASIHSPHWTRRQTKR
jgi:hypothetical protein